MVENGGLLYRCKECRDQLYSDWRPRLRAGGFLHSPDYLHFCELEPVCTLAEYLGVGSTVYDMVFDELIKDEYLMSAPARAHRERGE